MKYVLSLVTGLLAGAAAALALVYFNPLTLSQGELATASDREFRYSLGAGDLWLSAHGESLGLPRVPADAPLLFERGIKGSLLTAMPLDDPGGGPSAAASRISVPSANSELLQAGLLVDDFWLISVPGSGSVFVHAVNNQWPLVRDTVVRVDWLKRDFDGPIRYEPTQGPVAMRAEVTGLTGEFAGMTGGARESLSLESYSGSLASLSGRLLIDLGSRER